MPLHLHLCLYKGVLRHGFLRLWRNRVFPENNVWDKPLSSQCILYLGTNRKFCLYGFTQPLSHTVHFREWGRAKPYQAFALPPAIMIRSFLHYILCEAAFLVKNQSCLFSFPKRSFKMRRRAAGNSTYTPRKTTAPGFHLRSTCSEELSLYIT